MVRQKRALPQVGVSAPPLLPRGPPGGRIPRPRAPSQDIRGLPYPPSGDFGFDAAVSVLWERAQADDALLRRVEVHRRSDPTASPAELLLRTSEARLPLASSFFWCV